MAVTRASYFTKRLWRISIRWLKSLRFVAPSGSPIGRSVPGRLVFLEIELMAKIEPSSWKNVGQDAHIILPYIFQSVALWVANEVRAPEEPKPLVSAESFAPLVENDTEGYRATFLLRLSTTLPE